MFKKYSGVYQNTQDGFICLYFLIFLPVNREVYSIASYQGICNFPEKSACKQSYREASKITQSFYSALSIMKSETLVVIVGEVL